MTKMRNFKINENLSPEQAAIAKMYNASYIVDEDGNDWYEIQKELSDTTWKVVIDTLGSVVAFSKDASSLYPIGCSVVDVKEVTSNLNNKGLWIYDFKSNCFTYDFSKDAEGEKDNRLSEIRPRIQYLSDKNDDGDITESETEELLMLRRYRADIRKIDVSKAPDIAWPSPPTVIERT